MKKSDRGGERQVPGRFFSRGLSRRRLYGKANELTRAVFEVQGSSVQGRIQLPGARSSIGFLAKIGYSIRFSRSFVHSVLRSPRELSRFDNSQNVKMSPVIASEPR
jgi:hypothetical protein